MEQQKWVQAPNNGLLHSFTHRVREGSKELILRFKDGRTEIWAGVSVQEFRLLKNSKDFGHFNAVYESIRQDIKGDVGDEDTSNVIDDYKISDFDTGNTEMNVDLDQKSLKNDEVQIPDTQFYEKERMEEEEEFYNKL